MPRLALLELIACPMNRTQLTKQRTAVVKRLRRLFSGFLNIDEALVSYPRHDGTLHTATRLSVERGDSVAIAIVDRLSRTVWLTEQFRYSVLATGSGWITETAAGGIDQGETPFEAARREALEETGFSIDSLESVATFYVSPGCTSERIFLFFAAIDGQIPGGAIAEAGRHPREDVALFEQDLDEFLDECRAGRIEDGKTLIAGLWILANRERLKL